MKVVKKDVLLSRTNIKKINNYNEYMSLSLWDTVKGSPSDIKGKKPLLLTVVLLRALWFLPMIPPPGGGTSLWKGANQNDNIKQS